MVLATRTVRSPMRLAGVLARSMLSQSVLLALMTTVLILPLEATQSSQARRQMLQVEKEIDTLGYYPTGDPFVDNCLAALKSDSQGRLMPESCPKYSMALPPPLPGTLGCLGQEVAPALKDTLGRQVVVILEDNGWESQRLVNHLVSTVLQEALGYRVAYLSDLGTAESAQRVGVGTSHAVLEYWSHGKASLYGPEVKSQRIRQLSSIGYMGEAGLYALSTSWDVAPGIWWDYYQSYAEETEESNAKIIQSLLPRNTVPNSVPPRSIRLTHPSSAGNIVVAKSLVVESYICTEVYCEYGQFYPPQCEVNATSKLTHCPEIFFEYPQYNEGYFEALLTNAKMKLTALYLGDRSGEVIRDVLRQKKAAVFYGYHPSAVYSTLNATQISFPQRPKTDSSSTILGEGEVFGYPRQQLMKMINSRIFEDPLLEPAATMLNRLELKEDIIYDLIKLYQVSNSVSESVCEYLQSHPTLQAELLLNLPSLPSNDIGLWELSTWNFFRVIFLLVIQVSIVALRLWISLQPDELHESNIPMRVLRQFFCGPMIALGIGVSWVFILRVVSPSDGHWLHMVFFVIAWLLGSYIAWFLVDTILGYAKRTSLNYAASTTQDSDSHMAMYLSAAGIPFLRSIFRAALLMASVIVMIQKTGNATLLVLITSTLGFTLALALSDIFKDFVSGAIVLSDRQYQVGDWVKIHVGPGVEGCIEEISLRHTNVRGFDNHLYSIKNRDIASCVVENAFAADQLRIYCEFCIGGGQDPGRIRQFVDSLKIQVKRVPGVDDIKACFITEITNAGYHFKLILYTNHSPNNDKYSKLKMWGYAWVWLEPFTNARTDVALLVGHLLKQHNLHLGGEMRFSQEMPAHVHQATVLPDRIRDLKTTEESSINLSDFLEGIVPEEEKPEHEGENADGFGGVEDGEELTRVDNYSVFTTSFNMAHQPLPEDLSNWLPLQGAYDIVVVSVQGCTYKPRVRSEEWLAAARKSLNGRILGGRVHFDFLGSIVNHLGWKKYKLVGDYAKDHTRIVVFAWHTLAPHITNMKVDATATSSIFTGINQRSMIDNLLANAVGYAVGISFMVKSARLLFINFCLPNFDATHRQTGLPFNEVRNKMLITLLQQLRGVHQLAAADLLMQFSGVVLMGSFNYGSIGTFDEVLEKVTKAMKRMNQRNRPTGGILRRQASISSIVSAGDAPHKRSYSDDGDVLKSAVSISLGWKTQGVRWSSPSPLYGEGGANEMKVITRHGSVDGLVKMPSVLTATLSADEVLLVPKETKEWPELKSSFRKPELVPAVDANCTDTWLGQIAAKSAPDGPDTAPGATGTTAGQIGSNDFQLKLHQASTRFKPAVPPKNNSNPTSRRCTISDSGSEDSYRVELTSAARNSNGTAVKVHNGSGSGGSVDGRGGGGGADMRKYASSHPGDFGTSDFKLNADSSYPLVVREIDNLWGQIAGQHLLLGFKEEVPTFPPTHGMVHLGDLFHKKPNDKKRGDPKRNSVHENDKQVKRNGNNEKRHSGKSDNKSDGSGGHLGICLPGNGHGKDGKDKDGKGRDKDKDAWKDIPPFSPIAEKRLERVQSDVEEKSPIEKVKVKEKEQLEGNNEASVRKHLSTTEEETQKELREETRKEQAYSGQLMWADRILWKAEEPGALKQVWYKAMDALPNNPHHRPVVSVFDLAVRRVAQGLGSTQLVGRGNGAHALGELCSLSVTGLKVSGLPVEKSFFSKLKKTEYYMIFFGDCLLIRNEAMGDIVGPAGRQSAPSGFRTEKKKGNKDGTIVWDDELVPSLRSCCRSVMQFLQHSLVCTLVERSPWNKKDVVIGSCSLFLGSLLKDEAGACTVSEFHTTISSGGRSIAEVAGFLEIREDDDEPIVDDNEVVMHTVPTTLQLMSGAGGNSASGF